MEWIVFAETTGLLTFPPERPTVTLGPCQVWLKNQRFASDSPYTAPISAHGLRITKVERPGPVGLMFKTTVEAQSQAEARGLGYAEIELAADLLTLASGGTLAPVHVTNVHRSEWVNNQMKYHHEAALVVGEVSVWRKEHEEVLGHIGAGLHQLTEGDYRCVRNALRWLRRAGVSNEPSVQFVFLWFAIEALSDLSCVQAGLRPIRCRACQKPLTCTCGADQSVRPDVRGGYLLVDTLGVWSKKEYRQRYQLRSKVVHGDIGVLPGEEEQEILDAIGPLRSAVLTTLERLLNGELPRESQNR